MEQKRALVQGGYLSGIAGGISKHQWRTIEHLPEVAVAAPIAMLGYVVPTVDVPVDLDAQTARPNSVTRLDVTWRYDNGLSVEHAVPDFVFLTHKPLTPIGVGNYYYHYGSPDGPSIGPSKSVDTLGLTEATRPSIMTYCSTKDVEGSSCIFQHGAVASTIRFPFPMLLAAVDPVSEAKLTGLGANLPSGSQLGGASLSSPYTMSRKVTPVLAAAKPATTLQAEVRVSRLGGGAVKRVLTGKGASAMVSLPHSSARTLTLDGVDAYHRLLKQLRRLPHYSDPTRGRLDPSSLSQRFAIGTPRYRQHGSEFVPATVPNNISRYITDKGFSTYVPAGMGDVAVRDATSIQGTQDSISGIASPASVQVIGNLPNNAAPQLTDATSQVLSGILSTPSVGADATSARLLGHKPLAPSPNVAGLVQPPPLLITSLDATGQWYDHWDSADQSNDPTKPISAIRVRVANVTGVDQTSRERVRLAAQRIQQTTGLDVDITLGASLTNVDVADPAGKSGRPKLSLTQQWVKKGVATTILKAVDRKSVAVFALVLLVSALTVANAAIASVRARRAEFGVLACLGWTRRDIAGLVLIEITLLAGFAGAIAVVLSLLFGRLVGTAIGLDRALLALPAALLVAVAAGIIPVWQAGRTSPMGAIRAPVRTPRRAISVRSVLALARVNLTRNKTRTVLGASGLTVAVAASTFLVVITLGFRGAVVGTLLGDAVAVQVREADYAAVAATLLLALLGVANVMYLNIRERGSEFATLSAVGWSASDLTRSTFYEALGLGLLGTLTGVVLGLGAANFFLVNTPLSAMLLTALTCTGLGILVTLIAVAATSRLLHRLPLTTLLTED